MRRTKLNTFNLGDKSTVDILHVARVYDGADSNFLQVKQRIYYVETWQASTFRMQNDDM